jgi:hypothetical protein
LISDSEEDRSSNHSLTQNKFPDWSIKFCEEVEKLKEEENSLIAQRNSIN